MSNDDNGLLQFIASTVEVMRDRMATMQEQMATKADLDRLEAKMATKEDLRVAITEVRGDIERVNLRLDSIERALSSRLS